MKSLSEPEILYYRPSTIKLYYLGVGVNLVGTAAIVWWGLYQVNEGRLYDGLFRLAVTSTIPLSFLIRLIFYIRPRLFSRYKLYDDRLVMEFSQHTKEIVFAQVLKVRLSFLSPRFWGGFHVELSSGQWVTFLSVLKGSEKILERIASHKTGLIAPKKVEQYKRMKQLVEISWQRIREKIQKWPQLLFKYLVFELLLTVLLMILETRLLPGQGLIPSFLATFLVVAGLLWMWAAVINHLEERAVNQRILLLSGDAFHRDLEFERKMIMMGRFLFYGGSLLAFAGVQVL